MKFSTLLAVVALTSVTAHHRCDDGTTGETNSLTGPLAKAVQNAKNDMDQAVADLAKINDDLAKGSSDVTDALNNMAAAEANYKTTLAKIGSLQTAYTAAAQTVTDCNPSAAGSTCDINTKNIYAIRMQTAGEKMIQNDEVHQKNKVVFEQMTSEYQIALSSSQFDTATLGSKVTRATSNVEVASATYQDLKDQLDKHAVTGIEAQRECMIAQYHNDMQEKDKLGRLLEKCKMVGCSQKDYDEGFETIATSLSTEGQSLTPEQLQAIINAEATVLKRYTVGGKVRLPDCPEPIGEECFWSHYKKYGWFDFLSVMTYPIALLGCASMTGYDYGFCFSNFPYALTDSFTRILAPYTVSLVRAQNAAV